jgi:cyclophilin family peptidyl-prolyl cis-trans isomerase
MDLVYLQILKRTQVLTKSKIKSFKSFLFSLLLLLTIGCGIKMDHGIKKSDLQKDVSLKTEMGFIILRLSDDTPKHRDNFIKLINQGFYDGISFHRVINNFLVQTGNPETKTTPSTVPETAYTIPAEINPSHFHKRGAVNAARMGDNYNPSQASSGTQFTIIQGKTYTDSTLAIAEKRINNWLAYNKVINDPNHKSLFEAYTDILKELDALYTSDSNEDIARRANLVNSSAAMKTKLDSLTELAKTTMTPYVYPEAHRSMYKTHGGAAHLDQNYVVFGEVIKGMDIVDRIAAVQTDSLDKPISDVRILSATMIERASNK